MPPKKKDIYRITSDLTDAALAEKSRLWQSLFTDHLAAFTAFDSTLDATFATAWLQKIEAFEGHPTDETMLDDQQDKMETVEEKLKSLLAKVDQAEYYVRQMTANNELDLREFEFEQFRKLTALYHIRVAMLTLVLLAQLQHYQAALLAVNMPATLEGDLDNLLEAFSGAVSEHEYMKRVRIRQTIKRIRMFNELFALHKQVHQAALNVFANDPLVAKQFTY